MTADRFPNWRDTPVEWRIEPGYTGYDEAVAFMEARVEAIRDGRYDEAFVETLLEDLEKVYNRGLSDGYYLGREQGWSRAYGSRATRRKVYLGKVTHYYPKIGVAEIDAIQPVSVGDEYVIIGDSSGAVEGTITAMQTDDGPAETVAPGTIFAIEVKSRVRPGDKYYRMVPVETAAAASPTR